MNRRDFIAAVVGLLVAAVFGVLWNILGTGVEGTVASNPAIISLETKIEDLESELATYRLASEGLHATQNTQLEALIKGQTKIIDIMIGDG